MTAISTFRLSLAAAALTALASTVIPVSTHAAPAAKPDLNHAAVVEAVSTCRKLADNTARLACFDKAASALDEAQAQGQVMVVDREQVKTVRRQSFGFNIPSMAIFTHGPKEEAIDKVTVTLTGGHQGADGKWRFVTDEDAVWRQTDSQDIFDPPHAGSQMTMRHGALGSFFCKIDNQSAIRCARER